jgi:hypothetical protein
VLPIRVYSNGSLAAAAAPLSSNSRENVVKQQQAPCLHQHAAAVLHALQAMHKLGEPTALVKVRQADTMLVKEVMEPARKQYAGTGSQRVARKGAHSLERCRLCTFTCRKMLHGTDCG